MIVNISKDINNEELNVIKGFFDSLSLEYAIMDNNTSDLLVMVVNGDTYKVDEQSVLALNKVISVNRINPAYYLASRAYKKENTIVKVGNVTIGDGSFKVIAGPCSVESYEQIIKIAKSCKDSGAVILRGGAFKPRTSPYFFQGLGEDGLDLLKKEKEEVGLPVVTEIVKISDIDKYIDVVDCFQVGARNMQNYELLKALGKVNKPVLLKRSPSATIEEWLLSAEYILSSGNPNVILCERGIRTFEKSTRYTLDLSSVSVVKNLSHLPVIVDPSHSSGNYSFVYQMSLASCACLADGIMVEVHYDPSKSLSDAKQSLKLSKLKGLVDKCNKIKEIVGSNINE